jgi:hypothetical protein
MTALRVGQVMMWDGRLWTNAEIGEAAELFYVEHYGTMTADDATAGTVNVASIHAAIASASAAGGGIVQLPAGLYYIDGTITVPSNVTLRGMGMGKTTLYMPAASFTNTTLGTHGATSLAIEASGMRVSPYTQAENITVRDFTIESETDDGRCLYGIRCDNVLNPIIDGIEVFGIPVGNLIELNSVAGGAVRNCYLHDCFTDLDTYVGTPQMTGIEFDNNRINSVNSYGTDVHGNFIEDLTFNSDARGTYGMQTDAINPQNGSGIRIHGNYIETVGEGIDTFASDGVIYGNVLVDCYHAAIKLIHGASRNNVYGNKITRPGRSGITLSGGVGAGTDHNYIHDNNIHDVNSDGAWTAVSNAALHTISGDDQANNNTFRNNKITGGTNMKYAIRNEEGATNRYYDNEAETWSVAYSSVSGGSATIINQATFGVSAAHTIASGVITLIGDFGGALVEVDTEGAAASDDLDTISGGRTGQIIVLSAADNDHDVVLKDGTGNLRLGGDRTLDTTNDTITLYYTGSAWLELAFANNA